MNARRNAALGAILSAGGGICWGLSGSMGQYLFDYEGMDSRWLVPIRLGLAGVILFFYCLLRYRSISCCQFLYFLTIQLSTAGVGTILQDLSPVMILLVTCVAEKRRPGALEIISILLALVGVILITTHGNIGHLSVPVSAIVTGTLCAGCVTVYNVEPKRLLDEYPVTILQAWAFLLGSACLSALFHPWTWGYRPTAMGYFGIAFVVIVGNVIAFTSYMAGVRMIGPNKAILYGFSEPITAAIVGIFVFRNVFTVFDGIGFGMVFLMMYLISKKSERSA